MSYPQPPRHHLGFTLIELIMVMVILGVLAAYATPRIFDTSAFNARGFHDETLAYLRFAQKTAIAQRRTVCVDFSASGATPGTVTLTIAANAGTFTCASAGTLRGPKGENPVVLTARSGITFATTPYPAPADFNFDGLGQPITSAGAAQATQTIQVSGASNSVTIETGTGYVHE